MSFVPWQPKCSSNCCSANWCQRFHYRHKHCTMYTIKVKKLKQTKKTSKKRVLFSPEAHSHVQQKQKLSPQCSIKTNASTQQDRTVTVFWNLLNFLKPIRSSSRSCNIKVIIPNYLGAHLHFEDTLFLENTQKLTLAGICRKWSEEDWAMCLCYPYLITLSSFSRWIWICFSLLWRRWTILSSKAYLIIRKFLWLNWLPRKCFWIPFIEKAFIPIIKLLFIWL